MIVDKLLLFSNKQDLTQAQAGSPTPSTNVVDFSQARDFGPTEGFKVFVEFASLPVGPSGTTLSIAVQVSTDNQTWTTLEDFPSIDVTTLTQAHPFAVRAKPAFSNTAYRYMRLTYSPSQALSSGIVMAGINLDVPAQRAYPKNYVA
ncbi:MULTISPECIES: Bbp16 family capsid cement protein [unclassified Saccharibacter]|uniref:Bbp16 family capsid cement protein n=1 Tax=unclassified Saccharibacter TaxID=2648722 RepID=UPI00132408DF|nr:MULTISPECIES: hypothetical protein [unclassified Saccharibacter]MXV35864.1 hypothetical protein [Saccharibacter sp. EH611]MXV57984.1 hypothetical protein [Saccharibacter sp. EH70]MXV66379.1 hypothetical protein [Saccharibacter sp. EH60]